MKIKRERSLFTNLIAFPEGRAEKLFTSFSIVRNYKIIALLKITGNKVCIWLSKLVSKIYCAKKNVTIEEK